MKTNANDPINPHKHLDCNGQIDKQHRGLTKREYFAAMAMQGLISYGGTLNFSPNKSPLMVADLAIDFADKLIDALNRESHE